MLRFHESAAKEKDRLKVRKEEPTYETEKGATERGLFVTHHRCRSQVFLLNEPPLSSDEAMQRGGRLDPRRRIPLARLQLDGLSV